MKVILLTDVKNVGKKGDVKEVADGYGRNYLIKNRLAVEASKKSMEILNQQNEKAAEEFQAKKAEALKLKEQIEKLSLVFPVKSGADGRIFGSVSTAKICEQLQSAHHITVDKRKFVDTSNLTTLGHYDVKVELFKDVIATIKVDLKSL